MCGVCGVYNARSGEPVSPDLIECLTRLIAHRGPDDAGAYLDGPTGLGLARLSVIDLGGGHEPMSNETGDVWIVFNGEIWNYKSLCQELTARGHLFRTRSVTETIIHAYEEYGVDGIPHLHGMFGLAIWDSRRRRLLLARDRTGKKPFYYMRTDGGLVFASEIESLLAHRGVKRKAAPRALADFLSVRYVPGPATLLADIYKVLPGHWLLCENGSIREQCYWDFTFGPTKRRPVAEYIAGIRHHVHRSAEEHKMPGVPVGTMLSGSVDSSIVTGVMSQLTSQPVKTFAVGFDVPGLNKLPYARLGANHFGTEHHELVMRSTDLAQYWPLLTWHRDEPVSQDSDLGDYLISRLAQQHVKVVLSGEGGDELFAGYPKYAVDWLAHYYHLLPASLREEVMGRLLDHLLYSMREVKMAAGVLGQPAPYRWMAWFGVFNGRLKDKILSAQTRASIDYDGSRAFKRLLERNPQRDDLSSMLYLDTKIWLPDNLLINNDKMMMAASPECRVPLLDYRLAKYAASIPSSAKVRPFQPKYLFKRAFSDLLSALILTCKKMGFNIPISIWFREGQHDLVMQLLLSDRARDRGLLNSAAVACIVHAHQEGSTNYGNQLFHLASLELWFRVFIDSPAPERSQVSVDDLLRPGASDLTDRLLAAS